MQWNMKDKIYSYLCIQFGKKKGYILCKIKCNPRTRMGKNSFFGLGIKKIVWNLSSFALNW